MLSEIKNGKVNIILKWPNHIFPLSLFTFENLMILWSDNIAVSLNYKASIAKLLWKFSNTQKSWKHFIVNTHILTT